MLSVETGSCLAEVVASDGHQEGAHLTMEH